MAADDGQQNNHQLKKCPKSGAENHLNERGVEPHANSSTNQVLVGEAHRLMTVNSKGDAFDKIGNFAISIILFGSIVKTFNVIKIRDRVLV